ncbi:MAG: molybdopterin-dependent oxidoreductase [Chloroflexi bacterium]|nr:molybdopterin-dependent oxidoreductase [Chloroflexota bacterium]
MTSSMKIIGKGIRRTDALVKTTGEVAYAADWEMPRMLHLKLLHSPHPSARIVNINTQPALDIPDVVMVITAVDLPKTEVQTGILDQTGAKIHKLGEAPILAEEFVRYIGEAIAIVAAERLDLAEKGVAAIDVEFEELSAVTNPFDALMSGAPLVAGADNIIQTHRIIKGDIDAGFAQADHIIENTYTSQHIDHAFLEPEVGVGWLDSNGMLVLRASTQVIEHFRGIAKALDIPESKVRIMGTLVGGGFGGKEDLNVLLFIALATIKTRRSCKLVYTREETTQYSTKRHPYTIKHKYGVKKDGTLAAAKVELVSDAGAYAYFSPWVLLYSTGTAVGPYRIPNVEIDAKAVATNNIVASAFLGFGSYQTALAYEAQLDEVALTLNIDPLEVREKNFLHPGDTTAFGQVKMRCGWQKRPEPPLMRLASQH